MFKEFHHGLASVGDCFNVDIRPITKQWTAIYRAREKNHGKAFAVKFVKELNTVAERYALRQAIEPIPWTKSDKDGYPSIINFAKQNLRSKDPMTVVLTLSVFRTVEDLRLPISKDISTVTAPCSAETETVDSIIAFIPTWVKRIPPLNLRGLKYHFTLKNGPNGHAMKKSSMDISAVMEDPNIYGAIRKCEEILKGSTPMKDCDEKFSKQPIHSKLTQFPEKAGKTRTIAVIDYYSQRCLKPLHDGLMDILGKLVSDGTYSHQTVGKFVKQKTKEKSFIACTDLTAATDRFPAKIQEALLHELVKNPELSDALWTLLAKRTFRVAWSGEEVTYNCGQPMGAYGSWPLFALAHHLVVEYCAFTVGKSVKHQYKIIGDDNAIAIREVYEVYQSVMTKLGLAINKGKTVMSTNGADYSAAEVAKQLYLNGTCLTPLTPGFIRNIKKPYFVNQSMRVLLERYDNLSAEAPSMILRRLYSKNKAFEEAWMLVSNPINGTIKPGMPGYDEYSVWDPDKLEKYRSDYYKIITAKLIDTTDQMIDISFDLDRYLDSCGLGSPWTDTASKEPACYSEVRFSIERQLTKVADTLSEITLGQDPETILALVDFVPDPSLPYQDRKELRSKRLASSMKSLLDYKGDIEFVQLRW